MRSILLVAMLCGGAMAQSAAAQAPDPGPITADIRGLTLGLSANDMPAGFVDFACGSQGGPPLRPLRGWDEYHLCAKDSKGLHEVAVEYDSVGVHLAEMFVELLADEAEDGEDLWLDKFVGTKIAGHPVVLSVLFDQQGIVQGLRAVTDSRARVDQRRRANMLSVVIRNHYDVSNWTCETLPLEDGQKVIGDHYIKERCETVYRGESRMIVWRNFYRKAGQTGANALGQFVDGEWESSVRWDVLSIDSAKPGAGRMDIVAADRTSPAKNLASPAGDRPTEVAAFLAGETRDCPGCDLRQADLARRDLTGANLSGAILIEATLVESNLAGANLSQADLTEADLSLADMRQADLRGAVMHQAAFYRADLTLADLSDAYMRGGMLRRARMQRANLSGAYLIDSDLRGIRLAGAILEGANLGGSILEDATLVNLDLRGVNLEVTNLISANLTGANLEGANLRQADLYSANLTNTKLRDTNFTGARLQAANLLGANLHQAIFQDTILPSGDLHTGPLAAR